jgi:glutathione S-transferase
MDSNVSEVARFLLHRSDRTFEWMHIWRPREHNEAWHARMRADPAVKAVAETFI